jgi:hypothetical protein
MFWLKSEIEKNSNFYKKSMKKLEIKTMRTELKNIIPSIWNEWYWKPIKLLQKSQGKTLEIQRIRIRLENIIFGKLGSNDEIKNK